LVTQRCIEEGAETPGEVRQGETSFIHSVNLRLILRVSPNHLFKLLLLPLALLWAGGQVHAQQPVNAVTDNEVNEVARDIYCPVCENVPLDVCPTQACADWRSIVRQQLAEGQTKEEIIDYFAVRYGEQIRSAPPRYGVFRFFWLIPILGVGLAAIFFGRYFWQLQKRPSTSKQPDVTAVAKEDYLAQVEKELGKK
jgi:cytochrome c-type biogenesis protein CcmH